MQFDSRVYNFSAGPSQLPLEVLEAVQKNLLNYNHTGQSVMEMSHRSKEYLAIWKQAEQDLRDVLEVPKHFKVLNLQGGATLQFAGIPMNVLGPDFPSKLSPIYCVTGAWSEKAYKEVTKYAPSARVAVNTKNSNFKEIPAIGQWNMSSTSDNEKSSYLYYCDNETVHGVEFPSHFMSQNVPEGVGYFVGDMSSNFMSRRIDYKNHGIIYAGIQKNLGPAGNTVIILDETLLNEQSSIIPTYCSYKTQIANDSMLNTPAAFSVYVMGEYLKYTKSHGGIDYWQKENDKKARLIYDFIDGSDGFYSAPVEKSVRSRMNVVFKLQGGEEQEKQFLKEAEKQGLINLAGHRSVGGLRASIYNGVPFEGVVKLVDFMAEFKEKQQTAH
jgi:phosphoserine aminotransferase